MTPVRFRLSYEGLWFSVLVAGNRAEMYRAYQRMPGADLSTVAEALVCPSRVTRIDSAGKESRSLKVGHIFFHREALSTEVVAHEMLHAAMALYREREAEDPQFGEVCGRREEKLALIVGRLVRLVTNKLYDGGLWGTEQDAEAAAAS